MSLAPFAGVPDAARRHLRRDAETLALPAGAVVFEAGQECRRYIVMQSGSIRVHLLDDEGRQVVLYRLSAGDTCILTTAALLGRAPYPAFAVAEIPTTVAAIPATEFQDLLARSADFRRFVFASHAERIKDLMRVVSDVAFRRIDVRLARCLLDRADAHGMVAMTHETIATEIGSTREVVSRHLKLLEHRGSVRLGQRHLTVLDHAGLATVASGAGRQHEGAA